MSDNWNRPSSPPPPLFIGEKEKNFQKQVNDEVIERIVGQAIVYYPISLEHTNYHPLYGEAIKKTFLPPVHIYALVEWQEYKTSMEINGMLDKTNDITIHFHKRRLTEDQNLFVREGDFVFYIDKYYEIVSLSEPKRIYGQNEKVEISALCRSAREGLFDGN